ncbi:hypothetical protein [Histophilus somni]|nr:hypothetical protein [Histophilus somni]
MLSLLIFNDFSGKSEYPIADIEPAIITQHKVTALKVRLLYRQFIMGF